MLPAAALVASLKNTENDTTTVRRLTGWLVLVCVTLPVMIWELALYWVCVLDIFCKDRGFGLGNLLSRIWGCLKCVCVCGSLVFALFIAGISIGIVIWSGQ